MGSFATLRANLNLNIQNFSNQLRVASGQANRFAANLNGKSVQAMQQLNKQTVAWGLNMKSVSRVVSGILISQAFYKILQSIRQATDAVWQFAQQLEYAQIAYSNLFGDTQLAMEFINVLKDFAALTPFGFTEAEKSAKRLLAYGIEYKNVMYVMQGVLAASAAQGDSMKIEQISRALGQIYTYGKLMTAEVRQLTEAGIPVYDILKEKLGLSQEQLKDLGREAIPASVAINAIIDGINERFGNVLEASSKTIQGIISNIKDNATMLFAGIFEPFTIMAKAFLYDIGQFFYNMREIMETSGVGGVFEAIVPPEFQATLRLFIANLMNVGQAIIRLGLALGGILKPAIHAVVLVFNAFAPVLTTVANILSSLVIWVTSNSKAMRVLTMVLAGAAAMWVVFKLKALATAVVTTVILGISKALAGLSAMLTFVMSHPFWALLIGLTGVLVGISGGFGVLSDKVNSFFKSLTKFNGIDPDKLLLPSQKERANDLGKFNNRLEDTSDAMDDLADSTGKATKAAKNLLSFDEVFKLKDPDEGTGSGIDTPDVGDLGDIDLGGLGGLGGAYIPEIPDFSEYMSNLKASFVDKFKAVWTDIKDNVVTAALGTGLGAIIGSLIGGPVGAKIGAAIGALAGWIWADLADKLGMSDLMKVSIPLGTLVGTAIGLIAGGPAGAAIGAAVGTFVGWLAGLLGDGIRERDPMKIAVPIGTLIGAAIGFVVGGPAGAVIGSGIGTLVGWLAGLITEGIQNKDPVKIATPIGTLLGTAIGFIAGGPIGAAIGAAIGSLVGWITGKIIDADWNKIGKELYSTIGEWFLGIGSSISEWLHESNVAIKDFVSTTSEKFTKWATDTKDSFSNWKTETYNKISTWVTDNKTAFTDWKTETYNRISTWVTDNKAAFTNWKTETYNRISTWVTDNKTAFTNWKTETYNRISTWSADTKKSFSDWKTETYSRISTWSTDTKKSFSDWKTETYNKLSTWVSDNKKLFTDWWTNVNSKFDSFKNVSFSGWASKTYKELSGWAMDVWDSISDKIGKAINKVKEFFNLNASGGNVSVSATVKGTKTGHATGGIFNREHIARFAEGNKAEMAIPLENNSAMQPFVDAISRGIIEGIAPTFASLTPSNAAQQWLPPMYVGTLIADERGIKQLYKKFELIKAQEDARRGLK